MSTQIQNFYESTLTRNWTATTGDFNVSVAPTISEGIIVISPSSRTLREIVRFTATGTNAYGPFVTVSNIAHRGLGGTTAQVHQIGEKVRMNITAEHWTEMQDDITYIVSGLNKDACSVTVTTSSTASENEYNAFDEDNYASYTSTNNITAVGIIYNKTNGSFTIKKNGTYLITGTLLLSSNSATAIGNIILKLNGTAFNTHNVLIHSSVDPASCSFSIIKTLEVDDVITLLVDSTTTSTWQLMSGSTLNILQI